MHVRYSKHDSENLKTALGSMILPDKVDKWNTKLDDGDEAVLILLILLICPRIQTIQLTNAHQEEKDRFSQIQEMLTDSANRYTAFTGLEHLYIHDYDCLRIITTGMLNFFMDSALSLRSLSAAYTSGGNEWGKDQILAAHPNLESLHLEAIDNITLEDMRILLKRTIGLKVFTFSNYGDFAMSPKPFHIAEVMSADVRDSLETLEIYYGPSDSRTMPNEDLMDLHDFSEL